MFADDVIFVCAAQLVDKAQDLLQDLYKQGLADKTFLEQSRDTVHVHVAMVDVFARAGKLSQAEEYLMKHTPLSESAHCALLSAARHTPDTHAHAQDELERAERIYTRALQLEGYRNHTENVEALHKMMATIRSRFRAKAV